MGHKWPSSLFVLNPMGSFPSGELILIHFSKIKSFLHSLYVNHPKLNQEKILKYEYLTIKTYIFYNKLLKTNHYRA